MVKKCLLLNKVKIGKKEVDHMKHGSNIFLLKMASMKCLIRKLMGERSKKDRHLLLKNKQVKPSSPLVRISLGMS